MNCKLFVYASIIFSFTALSCEKDPAVYTSKDARLQFSTDTLRFDTVFSSIGSATRRILVYNPYNKSLKISSIKLGGGSNSFFKLNIDGTESAQVQNIEIYPKDSLYIFVQVLVNPSNQNNPVSILDSISFETNGSLQNITLQAIGQNVHLLKKVHLTQNTEWINDKPYLIYDTLFVNSGNSLTIDPGVKIYMHRNATIMAKGSVKMKGTLSNNISIQGDRTEKFYQNISGQWNTISLQSTNNEILYTSIINGSTAIQLGTPNQTSSPDLYIANSKIINHSNSAIYAFNANIEAKNLILANCGYYLLNILLGGTCNFNQCTFYNQGVYAVSRTSPSVYLSDTYSGQTGSFPSVNFYNSIIWGYLDKEFSYSSTNNTNVPFFFDYCILRMPSGYSFSDQQHYGQIWNTNPKLTLESQNQDTLSIAKWNYGLDTLSVAKDKGKLQYAKLVPLDFYDSSRLLDNGPDLGAIERKEE
jgi:hypothetical protein